MKISFDFEFVMKLKTKVLVRASEAKFGIYSYFALCGISKPLHSRANGFHTMRLDYKM